MKTLHIKCIKHNISMKNVLLVPLVSVSVLFSHYMPADNIYFDIGSRVRPFGYSYSLG